MTAQICVQISGVSVELPLKCSSSHGEIELKLVVGVSALNPTLLEKHSSC